MHQFFTDLMGSIDNRFLACWPSRHLVYFLDSRAQALGFILMAQSRGCLDEVRIFFNGIDATPILKNSLGIATPGVSQADLRNIYHHSRLNASVIKWECDYPTSRELENWRIQIKQVFPKFKGFD